jgi:hypothetical protein
MWSPSSLLRVCVLVALVLPLHAFGQAHWDGTAAQWMRRGAQRRPMRRRLTESLCPSLCAVPVGVAEYVGCYRDQFAASDRDLIGSLLLNDPASNLITPQHCEDYCGQRQFQFVGSGEPRAHSGAYQSTSQ